MPGTTHCWPPHTQHPRGVVLERSMIPKADFRLHPDTLEALPISPGASLVAKW